MGKSEELEKLIKKATWETLHILPSNLGDSIIPSNLGDSGRKKRRKGRTTAGAETTCEVSSNKYRMTSISTWKKVFQWVKLYLEKLYLEKLYLENSLPVGQVVGDPDSEGPTTGPGQLHPHRENHLPFACNRNINTTKYGSITICFLKNIEKWNFSSKSK